MWVIGLLIKEYLFDGVLGVFKGVWIFIIWVVNLEKNKILWLKILVMWEIRWMCNMVENNFYYFGNDENIYYFFW